MLRNDKENLIVELTLDLALLTVEFSEQLKKSNHTNLSSQVFKSGTSIGANVREAQNAESKTDFIHKFKIAAKEADELQYWMELCQKSPFLPKPEKAMLEKLNGVVLVISKIISSSKK